MNEEITISKQEYDEMKAEIAALRDRLASMNDDSEIVGDALRGTREQRDQYRRERDSYLAAIWAACNLVTERLQLSKTYYNDTLSALEEALETKQMPAKTRYLIEAADISVWPGEYVLNTLQDIILASGDKETIDIGKEPYRALLSTLKDMGFYILFGISGGMYELAAGTDNDGDTAAAADLVLTELRTAGKTLLESCKQLYHGEIPPGLPARPSTLQDALNTQWQGVRLSKRSNTRFRKYYAALVDAAKPATMRSHKQLKDEE